MTVWMMNLIDNRQVKNRNTDKELKFRICLEKSILAIGWGVSECPRDWAAYRALADQEHAADSAYPTAVRNLQEMQKGDLVWLHNPVTQVYYLAQVTDDAPTLCCDFAAFDVFSCRRASIQKIAPKVLAAYGLANAKLYANRAIEQVRVQEIVDNTIRLFRSVQ